MKLHLNKTLRAALIAAIVSVGLALPQALASTATELNTAFDELLALNNYHQGDDYTFSYTLTTVGTSGANNVLQLGESYYFFSQEGKYGGLSSQTNGMKNATGQDAGWPAPSQTSSTGPNVWESAEGQQLYGWITRNTNGDQGGASSLNGSTITITYSAGKTIFELYHKNKNATDRVVMNGVSLDAPSFVFGAGTSNGTDLVFRAGKDYVWNGSDSSSTTWNTGNTNWQDGEASAALPATGNAVFSTGEAARTVTIGENVTAKNVLVQDDYVFAMGGKTITASAAVSIAGGKTLALNGTGTLIAGIVAGNIITKTGEGKLNLNATVNLNSVSVQAGEMSIAGTADNKGTIGSLRSYRGTTVELTNVTATAVNEGVPSGGGADDKGLAGNLVIGNGATVNATHDDGWNFKATNKLTVAKGGVLDMKGIRWTFENRNTIELAGGEITGQGNGTYGALDFNGSNTVKVTEDSKLSARLRLRSNPVTFEVAEGKNLVFTGDIVNQGNGGITKSGAGTMVMSGAKPTTGAVVVNAGTLDISNADTWGNSTITVNAATLKVTGTVADGVTISATNGATIDAADLDSSKVSIAAQATAKFKQGVSDETHGVYYTSEESDVTVQNTGTTGAIQYGIDQEAAKVTAEELVAYTEGQSPIEVKNQVVVDTVTNMGEASLTLTHVDTEKLTSVYAGADITLQNVNTDPVSLSEMVIAQGTTVAVYQGSDDAMEGVVVISDTLYGGSGTLLANLTLVGDSTLDLSLEQGGMQALTLGSKLTFDFDNSVGLVNLDDETIAALNNLAEGDKLNLITAKEQTELTYGGNGYDGMSYDDLFVRTEALAGTYTVYAKGDAFGLMKSTSPIPEPTTGTLSLLALMALAARRRRK